MPGSDDPEVLRAVLDSQTMGVYLVDRHGKILSGTPARSASPVICAGTLSAAPPRKASGYADTRDQDVHPHAAPLSPRLMADEQQQTEIPSAEAALPDAQGERGAEDKLGQGKPSEAKPPEGRPGDSKPVEAKLAGEKSSKE